VTIVTRSHDRTRSLLDDRPRLDGSSRRTINVR